MTMKKVLSILLLGTLLISVGCQKDDGGSMLITTPTPIGEEAPQPTVTPDLKEENKVEVPGEQYEAVEAVDKAIYTEGLNLLNNYTIEQGSQIITLEVYSSADLSTEGEVLYDDGQEWTIIAECGEKAYVLFERSYIQMGGLSYKVYTDYDAANALHIFIEKKEGAGFGFYDCVLNEEDKSFTRKLVYEAENINILSEWQ